MGQRDPYGLQDTGHPMAGMLSTMSWIRSIDYATADDRLRRAYDRVRGPHGEIDNILAVHSLRPHTLDGHMALYKNVLHHTANRLPTWLLELVGIHVSLLNGCDYCVEHHLAGLRRLLTDDDRTDGLLEAVRRRTYADIGPREDAILRYAERLTLAPASVTAADLEPMRTAGLDDGEILEVNQVVAYFAYANRTVSGLGVTTHGDVLGLSPPDSDDEGPWSHQ
jgi:uncharacterized peroxidase-related enzyme